jgi:hypothetical protein
MKKIILKYAGILLLLVLSSSIWANPAAALLQRDASPIAIENGEQSGAVSFSFEQLGEEYIQLRSPLDAYEVEFALPYRWLAQEGEQTYLALSYNLTVLEDISFLSDAALVENLPHLEIYLDDVLIQGFTPSVGFGQVVRIPIPAEVINRSNSNFHSLRMFYFRDNDCEVYLSSVLEIDSLTTFGLEYEVVSPLLSLAQFPRPLVQDSFFGEQLYLVLPDEYSESDLTAAAVISAAIGDLGKGSVEISTLYAAEATPELLANRNVIAIGQPDSNAFIAQAYSKQTLATGLDAQGSMLDPDGRPVSEEDGVLQLFTPDGKMDTVYLLVTGNSSEAVEKAAYALASADLQYGLIGDSAIIDQVYTNVLPVAFEESGSRMLFEDLGYPDTEYIGIGTRTSTFTFYLPHNWELSNEPSVTISYSHSSMLSDTNSVINLELNGNLVGSVPLDGESLGETEVTIQLRPEDFLPGEKNRLRITPILDINLSCERYDTNLTWLRIHGDSFLNIPHEVVADENGLLAFTNPFFYLLSSPVSNQILFHLPDDASKTELDGFINIARLIGQERRYPNQVFAVSFDQVLPDTFADYHVVAIGAPASSPVIQELNDSLPQSFIPGENTLRQVVGNVEYILASDFSVGVVEVIASPLNPQRGLSVITGTTLEGLSWALDAMSDPDQVRKLSGDLSFISEDLIGSVTSLAATSEFVQVTIEEVVGEEIEAEVVGVTEDQTVENQNEELTPEETGLASADFLPVVYGALLVAALLVTGITFSRNLRATSKDSNGNGG